MGKDLPENGYAIALLRSILKSEGIDLAVEFLPWSRTIQVASDPKYAGYYSAYHEEVTTGFTKSADVFTTGLAFVEPVDKPLSWKTLSDLKGKRIAYPQDGGTTDEFVALVKKGDIILDTAGGTDAEVTTLRKVASSRVDAGLINPQTYAYYVSKYPKDLQGKLQLNAHFLQENKPNVMAINDKFPNKNVAEILKRGLSKINAEKFISDYMKKYFGK